MTSDPLYILIYENFTDNTMHALGVTDDFLFAEETVRVLAESINHTVKPTHSSREGVWTYSAKRDTGEPAGEYTIYKTVNLNLLKEVPQAKPTASADALYKQAYNGLVIEQERLGSQDFWLIYDDPSANLKRNESRTWAIYPILREIKHSHTGRWDKLRKQWVFQVKPPEHVFALVENHELDNHLPKTPYFPVFQNNPAYDLIPRGIQVPRYGETDKEGNTLLDKAVYIKLFGIYRLGHLTWYIAEYTPETDEAFAFVYNAADPQFSAWEKISIRELHDQKLPSGLPIVERDLHFDGPKTLREALRYDNINLAGHTEQVKPAEPLKPIPGFEAKPKPEPQPDPLEGLTLEEKLARTEFVVVNEPNETEIYIGDKLPKYPATRHILSSSAPYNAADTSDNLQSYRVFLASNPKARQAIVSLIGHRIGIDHNSQHHHVIRELMEAYVAGEWTPQDKASIYLPVGYRRVTEIELTEVNGSEMSQPIDVDGFEQAQTVLEIWQARGVEKAHYKAHFERFHGPISGTISLEHDLPHNAIGRSIVQQLKGTDDADAPLNVYMPKTSDSLSLPPAIAEAETPQPEAFTELDW